MAQLLVVEDDPETRESLCLVLSEAGHDPSEAGGVVEAQAQLDAHSFDAVLLDLHLPDGSGLELLARLKAATTGRYLPILVITGQIDPMVHIEALRAGADDFVAKPVSPGDLLARLDVLLDVHAHRRTLARKHNEMAALAEFRDDLTSLLVHDLKNPLTVILGNLAYLAERVQESGESDVVEALDDSQDAAALLQRMIGNLLDVSRSDAGKFHVEPVPLDVAQMLKSLAQARRRNAEQRNIRLEVSAPEHLDVPGDGDVLRRVIDNLVENALRYSGTGGRVALAARSEHARVVVEVANTGPPIPEKHRKLVFEKYGSLGRRSGMPRVDLGLGLYFCRIAVEAHGGTIRVEERPDFPTTFVIELPAQAAARAVA